jgi:peptidoglycan-associated lipoprotein
MKKAVVLMVSVFLLLACEKPKLSTSPATSQPTQVKSDEKDKLSSGKASDKSGLEELEGLKKLSPEEVDPNMIAKAQSSLSDATVETGVLGKKIYFDFDSYELKKDARDILQEVAAYLKEYKILKIVVEGNCDQRGTREYNLSLGMKRAEAAKKYLSDLGIDDGRLQIVSYGKDKPVVAGSNEEAWGKNRRDQFRRVQ